MTNERAKLLQLLEEKKELFLEMEQVSEKMLFHVTSPSYNW